MEPPYAGSEWPHTRRTVHGGNYFFFFAVFAAGFFAAFFVAKTLTPFQHVHLVDLRTPAPHMA